MDVLICQQGVPDVPGPYVTTDDRQGEMVYLSSDGSEVFSIDGHLYGQTCPETPLIFWKPKNRHHVHRSV